VIFFKTFQTRVLLNLAIITLLLMGIASVLVHQEYIFALVILIPTLIGLLWQVFNLVNKTNADLSQFLLGIQYNDFEQGFATEQMGDSHKELYSAFNLITDKFRHLRSEQEAQNQLMQTIISNVDTGIFCADKDGKCLMINTALKQLLHKSYIPTFESLEQITPNVFEVLKKIKPGERKMVKETIQNEISQIAVQVYILKIKAEEIKVYTFYNIHNELSDQEVKSWQKLIRFLAHEIMNSIAPIASLSSSAVELIPTDGKIDDEDAEQLRGAFRIIQKRSESLMTFTETYRKLTRIPPPKLGSINMNEFFDEIQKLFEQDLKQKGIKWKMKFLYHEIHLMADSILLEQVFINIFKNAIEALEGVENPEISVLVDKTPQGKVTIQVMDNGQGIPQDVVDQIFVPFFTTKQNGSGIGLSLSQQIIRMHGGNIYLQSKEREGTVVTLSI
jgi:two-component system nitrogen regulation sensor histidine kinase NtrY